ncbi:MAG TPA: efflux RND transporter periplasmic adaptor subunit [Caulobacteraceae bacterium]|jgi:RND family efflux transporter MFP subunit|nr:efflux RND transporter periplasmic adaptor subunit [Caulobacteraceae bacterium]
MPDRSEVLRHKPQKWLKPAGLVGVAIGVAVIGVGLFTRVSANQDLSVATREQAIPTVSIIAPMGAGAAPTLALPGDVQAYYNAQIHARVNGYLKTWLTDIGAKVKAGQLLAVIDTPELDQQLEQAKADLATAIANQKLARTTSTRWTSLLADDAVSKQEAEEKSSDLEVKSSLVQAAQANVQRLQAMEGFKRIVAPFDGVVTSRTTDIGALIAAGAPTDPGLFNVADVSRLRIYVKAPQSYSADMRIGSTATLTVPEYPGRTFTATMVSTSGAVSDQSGTMTIELQADNPGDLLKPGDYAQVTFNLPAAQGLVRLPSSALMFRHRGMAVATLSPYDKVKLKFITISRDLGPTVEVASGLSPSDRVIDNPPDSLVDGEVVRVAAANGGRRSPAQEG